ncbi:hypothetical protein NDK47_25160 [Brevibacillus ruminantium]|uniref:Uncharacterized protein n=1 Tax=Brevibacillus ruminantium TaxID=2950604 RepID=A0ABY4WH56_9BACL|nr:hypothetical protein [Brevibacillus ruminantium]USG65357.1 hypothetical protein NDK47_25160 [Brevibacillus ruminantium]
MKRVVFSLLSMMLASSIAVGASAKETSNIAASTSAAQSAHSVITPMAIFKDREPNDTRAEANVFIIGDGNQITGSFPRGDSADWFTFTPTKTETYRFYFSHSSFQRYSLRLHGDGLGKVAEITFDSPVRYFDVTVQAGTTYYLGAEAHFRNYNEDDTYDIYTYKI